MGIGNKSLAICYAACCALIVSFYFLWRESAIGCQYALVVAMEGDSFIDTQIKSMDDDLVWREMKLDIDSRVNIHASFSKAFQRIPINFHISKEAESIFKKLQNGNINYDVHTAFLRELSADIKRGDFRCKMPSSSDIWNGRSFYLRKLQVFVGYENSTHFKQLLRSDNSALSEKQIRVMKNAAATRAELQRDMNIICVKRAATHRAEAIYRQFIWTCNNPPYGVIYTDCSQGVADLMSGQVRGIASVQEVNESIFISKWGRAILGKIVCY